MLLIQLLYISGGQITLAVWIRDLTHFGDVISDVKILLESVQFNLLFDLKHLQFIFKNMVIKSQELTRNVTHNFQITVK